MIRLATFAILFAVVYSYGVPQAPPPPPQYNPAPAPQYAPPPPPPQYYYEKSCKKAVITCGMGKMMLMTGDNEILAAGLGAQKVATCRGNGGWRAENVDGRMIDFDTVRCVTMAR
ncbi:hypothetical protein ANCCAN_00070 [Ancylostoma caninum]|uniref:C6 domain-containing protein n=1 Tax=Ancylostoma caninum TaxID=29170 RepID=A0A368HAL3_ANCCA|nr:hypothetical protein ANCCAN_00070 [Ancylostoma caninum]